MKEKSNSEHPPAVAQKTRISERINARFAEPEGKIFEDGKWRFWFPLLVVLEIACAAMTIGFFAVAGQSWQTYIGAIASALGAVLVWLSMGNLHYSGQSGSTDATMASRVSLLDSVALLFAVAHCCFLLWAIGRLATIQSAESKYEAGAVKYNADAKDIQAGNVKIAEATAKAEKLRNDTAYQQRRAAESGAKIVQGKSAAASLSTAPIELEKPEKPKLTSAQFVEEWDTWIRVAQFGELILAVCTLIYIRNRSAKFNAQGVSDAPATTPQGSTRLAAEMPALRRPDAKNAASVATPESKNPALQALRDHLRVIASYHPGRWFKADLIKGGGVFIRLCERNAQGGEKTVAKTRQSDKILAAVDRPDFPERLRAELVHNGFPIGKGGE